MPKIVQIGSTSYIIPEEGDKAGWGEDTTSWMQGVTDALENVQGPNDILSTSATLTNNQSSATNIPGLLFNVAEVESVEIDYVIKRVYDSGSTTVVESGKILGNYDGTDFVISQETTGDAGVEITVTSSGQFQYTTSDLANHVSSVIRFKSTTIDTP